jgi:hypothetical protein
MATQFVVVDLACRIEAANQPSPKWHSKTSAHSYRL